MREIIFRGQTRRNGEKVWMDGRKVPSNWVYGGVLQGTGSFSIIYGCNDVDDKHASNLEKHVVYTDTLGQYTGLTVGGEKIFEGDIIKFGINQRLMYVHMNEETLTWELTDVGVSAYEVNHLINTFGLAEIQVESAYGEVFSEKVGNIHDNPELLKGGVQE